MVWYASAKKPLITQVGLVLIGSEKPGNTVDSALDDVVIGVGCC